MQRENVFAHPLGSDTLWTVGQVIQLCGQNFKKSNGIYPCLIQLLKESRITLSNHIDRKISFLHVLPPRSTIIRKCDFVAKKKM